MSTYIMCRFTIVCNCPEGAEDFEYAPYSWVEALNSPLLSPNNE